MAVIANPLGSRILLRLVVGQDANFNPIYRTRSYSNIKPGATDEKVYEVGNALVALQTHDLEDLRRVNEVLLLES